MLSSAKHLQSLFDCVQGRHGLVGLGPDPSTPPGSAQDDKVRGRACAKSALVEEANHKFEMIQQKDLGGGDEASLK